MAPIAEEFRRGKLAEHHGVFPHVLNVNGGYATLFIAIDDAVPADLRLDRDAYVQPVLPKTLPTGQTLRFEYVGMPRADVIAAATRPAGSQTTIDTSVDVTDHEAAEGFQGLAGPSAAATVDIRDLPRSGT